jgi:hypothetical protein
MPKGNNAAHNNRSNQMNRNNAAYQSSRAGSGHSKPALDNRSVQLNLNIKAAGHDQATPAPTPAAKAVEAGK